MRGESVTIEPWMPNGAGAAKVLTCVVAAGGKGALRGAAGRAVRIGLEKTAGHTVARAVTRGGSKVAVRVAPVLAVAEFVWNQAATEAERRQGNLSQVEYCAATGGNAGNAIGGLGGALAGAAAGTAIFPGVGTVVGAILGGLLGGRGGRKLGGRIGEEFA